jgi:uncharacterized protein (TIGR02217 family)
MTAWTTSQTSVRFLASYDGNRKTSQTSARYLVTWNDPALVRAFTSVYLQLMGFSPMPSVFSRPQTFWDASTMILNEVFPYNISFDSISADTFEDDVTVVDSGVSQRVSRWDQPLREYNVAYGVRTMEQLQALTNFFRLVRGRQYGFLYFDPFDHWTTIATAVEARTPPATGYADQWVGSGNGTTTQFQLQMVYTSPNNSINSVRPIYYPIPGGTVVDPRIPLTAPNIRVSLYNGSAWIEQTSGWSVNYTTGILTFNTPPAPGVGIAWGGWFYIPVRFDTKRLPVTLKDYGVGDVTDVKLIELRMPEPT